MARSRLPVRVCGSGALSRSFAWSFISQFPTRVPRRSTPGTRSLGPTAPAPVNATEPTAEFQECLVKQRAQRGLGDFRFTKPSK
jgi:hypothetical protein